MTPPIEVQEIESRLDNMELDAPAVVVSGELSPATAMAEIKAKLTATAPAFQYLVDLNNRISILEIGTHCTAEVVLSREDVLQVLLEESQVLSLTTARGRMTLSRPSLAVRMGGQTYPLQRFHAPDGRNMVIFAQPLTAEGVHNCVKIIRTVFVRSQV